jgi:hypothetical protein
MMSSRNFIMQPSLPSNPVLKEEKVRRVEEINEMLSMPDEGHGFPKLASKRDPAFLEELAHDLILEKSNNLAHYTSYVELQTIKDIEQSNDLRLNRRKVADPLTELAIETYHQFKSQEKKKNLSSRRVFS